MKRYLLSLSVIALFVGTVAFASAKGPIKEKHQGKTGLDGQTVNCGYCHGKDKANVPKTKGNNLDEIKKSKYCAMKDCH
jgi:cytochrome c553